MAKPKRPSWFKFFVAAKSVIDVLPDEAVGKGVKAALTYFDTGEIVEIDTLSNVVFATLKPYIDESLRDYERSVNAGHEGANNRWNK